MISFRLLVLFALITSLISPAYVVFGLLAVSWAAARLQGAAPRPAAAGPLVFCLAMLALFTAASAAASTDVAVSVRHLPGLSLLLLVPITIDTVDDPQRARALVFALAAGAIAQSAVALWQFTHGGDDLENRIRGSLSHYMTFSGLATLGGCLLLGFALEARGGWRLVGLATLIPFSAVLLTYTRGAYVGIVAALLLYVAVRRPRGLLLLLPAVLVVFLLAPPGIRERIRSIVDLQDRTNRDRIAMVRAGARMVADYPILGLGPDMVMPYYPLYRDPDAPRWWVPHLHDNALQIAAANGVFASASYLLAVALVLARVIVLLRRDRDPRRSPIWAGALLAAAALTVAGLFEYNFGDTEVEMATLLVWALPFARFASG